MAATLNVAVCPALMVRLAGCVVMDGGAFTVNVAVLLVALETLLVTVTVNFALVSEAAADGVVYVAVVAPLMSAPFFFH